MSHKIVFLALSAMLFALCVSAEAQASDESPPDRMVNWWLPSLSVVPPRGIPGGSSRAWIRGRKKHRH
jgi:hypothetical protein